MPLQAAAQRRPPLGSTTTRAQLMALDSGLPGSHSQAGPAAVTGVSNYHLTVQSPRTLDRAVGSTARRPPLPLASTPTSNALTFLLFPLPPRTDENQSQALFFFDTGGGTLDEAIDASHVAWYRNASRALAAQGVRDGLAFLHIPLPEYTQAAPASLTALRAQHRGAAGSKVRSRPRSAESWGKKGTRTQRIAAALHLSLSRLSQPFLLAQPTCFGMRQDGINPFTDRGGLFAALKEEGNIHATFVGHGESARDGLP